jgi:ribonucleotide monophosphatase NagD (HAD superfamily)
MDKKNTIFCDIDGTIFKYRKFEDYTSTPAEPIHSTIEYLKQQKEEGHMIILTTARPDSLLEHTIWELEKNFVPYNSIITGIERGPRYLINDMDPNKPGDRAIAINLIRDQGIN